MVVASGQHTLPYGKRNLLQLGPVQLLDGGVKSIAVDVHDGLRQVPAKLELGDIRAGTAKIMREVCPLKLSLPGEDSVDLLG